jgi:hypothetical protein
MTHSTTDQEKAASGEVPVYFESLAGSLIDSARISVMAAMAMLPAVDVPLIVLPGTSEQMAEDEAASVNGCLEQAMEWLDAARAHTVDALAAKGAPPTSLHVVGR